MKKAFLITVLLMACKLLHASEGIEWLNTVYDFGAFSETDNKVAAEFRFVNKGSEPVTIISVAATCGCTVPKYSESVIAPSDTATIIVVYNPIGRPGRFEKYVYVRTSDSPDRETLTIKGAVIGSPSTVLRRYPIDMGDLKLRNGVAMLGRIPANSSKAESIDGYNASNDSLRITFDSLPPYLHIISSPEVVPPGEIVNFSFFFSGLKCKEWGIVTDSVEIVVNDKPISSRLPVVAIVEEDFSALTPQELADAPVLVMSSDRIELPDIPMSSTTPASGTVELTNFGKAPMLIHRVYSQDKALSWDLPSSTLEPGENEVLTVTYDPAGVESRIIDTRLTIIVNDPVAPTRNLRIVALRQ